MINDEIINDIIKLLSEALGNLEREEIDKLKQTSNKVIHNASLYQDPYSIMTAVIIYALSKLLEREKVKRSHPEWENFLEKVKKYIENAIEALEKRDIKGFEENMKALEEEIMKSESYYKMYIDWVLEKARIKKGSKIYEHGPSLEKTADLLGITVWELMEYIGKTNIHETVETKKPKERLKELEEVFG